MASSQSGFVNNAYNQARAAGLNETQARLAATQAANETGYGQHVVGNNYFGIKAGPSWNGDVVNAGTSEEVNGTNQRQRANFRSYASPVDSFSDYAGVLSRNFPTSFAAPDFDTAVDGLQNGRFGAYATDSHYGSKLRSINNMIGNQADQTTGIMGVINPATVGPVERGLLSAPVSPTNVPGINATPDLSSFVGPQPTPGYVDPQVTTAYQQTPQMTPATQAVTQQAQPASINTAAVQAPTAAQSGLLSPSEYGAFQQQKASLDNAAPNTSMNMAHVGQMAQKGLGAIAGGLLGGITLGPLGGLLGAYMGKQIASPNGLFGNNNFPTKPDSAPKGDGSLTSYGKSVSDSSGQFGRAMASGGVGLY